MMPALVTPSAGMLSSSVHVLSLVEPGAMVAAPDGGLYIYDTSRHQVLLRDPNGNMRVVAGNGVGAKLAMEAWRRVLSWTTWGHWPLAPDGTLYLSGGGSVRAVSHRESFRLSPAMAVSISIRAHS